MQFELWLDILTALALAPIAYAATNLDNLLVLSMLSRNPADVGAVRSGFIGASIVVLLLAASFLALSLVIPLQSLGLLGVIPITLGVRGLVVGGVQDTATGGGQLTARSVALILLANSTDTLAVFGPLFAESELQVSLALAAGFVVMAGVWLYLVTRIQNRLRGSALPAVLGRRVAPWLMILIGAYILANTWTDLA